MKSTYRRNALKALAVGAPTFWIRPVVDSVILPAHAQSTCPGTLCVTLNLVLTGNYMGGYQIELWDSMCNLQAGSVSNQNLGEGIYPDNVCFTLAPGEYTLNTGGGGGGTMGSVSIDLDVRCCASGEGLSLSSSGGGFSETVTIDSNGFCSFEEVIGGLPCP